ncbi:hypothetical protein IEE84_10675 [Psychrobacter sp. 28M-43]|uniref:hypothetical protein n=1 Tax=Psychrobacter sp. 28M-43 TaxID=2772254 RepID=UPI00168D6EB7|nr:hypothetical protein [Psychrobacter sp. 28M-43]QOD12333.1 hypothetical protein IEE84_10675 [Psychrobacter sp. 28M-43]
MKQAFNLRLATETIAKDAQELGVSIEELENISIKVSAEIIQQPALQLVLTYQVTLPSQILANQFNWPTWQQTQVNFTDYLWEETCLECFIAGSKIVGCKTDGEDVVASDQTEPHKIPLQQATAYIEINTSPDGRYALYQFENYRNPVTLPPVPLYETDGTTCASINWHNCKELADISGENPLSSTPMVAQTAFRYERSFSLPITQLPNQQYAIANMRIEQIHPCVILWFGKTDLYFASGHASPPDFHNRDYWPKFEL